MISAKNVHPHLDRLDKVEEPEAVLVQTVKVCFREVSMCENRHCRLARNPLPDRHLRGIERVQCCQCFFDFDSASELKPMAPHNGNDSTD
eukprot:CAMPEP_0182942278 /NCGR_PEP_ID=MMETSP0105_2-20130417/50373_1 /TAXON_ID=81532 ORGANISM="Acanthoeca-like sp., Strain 10tr" /NCGR_SAMPLE_ID=MMETSP0105_2 /ASSEMBLY_ACC=CAM_ASM_000205 /LENGTH=89 /DNA_ID=CAMNT_0025081985 /DNA_START=814 /DNA_END=1083 /DNA_ORIENTATION=+